MLHKNKNIVAKLNNQNGDLIQDGDGFFFIFHIISRHFDFLAWQQCSYFYIALELEHINK
jgi:hypothetical protein